MPFLAGGQDIVKNYCDECWIKMLRATEFGGAA